MTIRIRAKSRPGDDSKDIPCGPAHAERLSKIARLPIDEAIVYAAHHGHLIRASR